MPYIPNEDRFKFSGELGRLAQKIHTVGVSNGELNYIFTTISQMYLNRHGTSYNTLSDVVKALECCKLEFYHRAVRPYEQEKIAQYGDCY
jgi:hypothetical protein